ncbi:MAG: carboxypeptidase-like regulatory domain-containing protein [Gemmatimonadota bacterium]
MRIRNPTLAMLLAALAAASRPAAAQILQGHATGPTGAQVPDVLVRLMAAEGEQVAYHVTGPEGLYRLEVPAPGEYWIEAEALGWAPYRSARFEMTGLTGVFRVDLILEPRPVELPGLDVRVERLERVAEQLQAITGRSVAGLRYPVIGLEQFRDAWDLGWNLTDILRRDMAGIVVKETPTTLCIEYRKRCLPVYLNGMRVADEMVRELPLEMLAVGVVLQPSESIQYEGGGVLLYTIHWMQEAR